MGPQLINVALGLWLTAAPEVLGYGNPARTNDWVVGPITATIACIALWEATRGVRWWNVPVGAWLIVAPVILGYSTLPFVQSLLIGAAVTGLSFLGGRTRKSFGGGWRSLWRPELLAQSSSSSSTS
jgi:hypothetical protein